MKKVVVIGGGPAGMMAAGRAGELGNNVILFEKNNKVGKKLYLTGKGRCNLTNNASVETIIENIPGNPYFMYSSLYNFDSQSTINFFNNNGVKTKIERGNRVFPSSDKSSDIVKALNNYCLENNVKIILDSDINKILVNNKKITSVIDRNNKKYDCGSVIIATGGLSYPITGSDGKGYKLAKDLGHTITKLYPSLVPLKVKESWVKDLQGLSLKNVSITVKDGKKILYSDFGEMLFTHFGVSGPIILSASRYLLGMYENECKIHIDLKPALSIKSLDNRILRDFEKYKNRDIRNSLSDLLPQTLIPIIINISKINSFKKVNEITKNERYSLIETIKNLQITIIGTTGFGEAIITSGGVCVDEIDPSTMESKLIEGLFFAGEVLDIDAYTGGFNLQIAFSTAYTAGSNV